MWRERRCKMMSFGMWIYNCYRQEGEGVSEGLEVASQVCVRKAMEGRETWSN